MENSRFSASFLFPLLVLVMLLSVSSGQLIPSETRILFKIQKLLEYPEVFQGWSNWTNFCYLPSSPSLKIVCANGRVTELTVIGNRSSPSHIPKPSSGKFAVSSQTLSQQFSLDAFFTVLTKLSNLKVLSLVSLGMWGPFSAKIDRFWSLEVLNMSSNFIYGEIPPEIVSLEKLTCLVLADNLLNGSVPDLKSLAQLQELNLGGNNLGPKFPSLGNNLVTIVMSNNSFRSEIPEQLKNLNRLQLLDISSNNLLGPIPSSLLSLPSVQYLGLAQNQLSGVLPRNISCSSKLKLVNISHNLLTGKLPSCLASNSSNRTVISSWNCLSGLNYQHPHPFCHEEALAVKPTFKREAKSNNKLGLIIGVAGAVVGIAAVLVLLVLLINRRSNATALNMGKSGGTAAGRMSAPRSFVPTIDSRRVPQTMRSAAIGLAPYRVFTLEEIEDATNNFDPSNLVDEGNQGRIYKGWLRDGSVVMVKCVTLKQKNLPQNLMQHMETLSKLRHLHLVSVLGHCTVTYQEHQSTICSVFVVLEHVSNGSLQSYLSDWRKKEVLKWPQRMAITIGVTRGIQFLHTGVAPGIYGNNIKIEHVLLDDSLTAKLSNYNIPLPSKVGSGSPLPGQETNNLSSESAEKEDVYQLGVILIQVITGKLVTSPRELEELKIQLEDNLSEAPSRLRAVVDPDTRGTFAYESLRTAVEITMNCLNKVPSNRPSIEDVLWNLQYSIQTQEGWTSSGNLSTQFSGNF